MRKNIKRILLIMTIAFFVMISSESTEIAHCANCPTARLNDSNYIQCLDGQQAWCKSGPSCGCQGPVSKTNECGGACSVHTNWGMCSIQCQKGVHATCVQGRKEWQGLQQIIIEPHCSCGGTGSVAFFRMDSYPENNDKLSKIIDTSALFVKDTNLSDEFSSDDE